MVLLILWKVKWTVLIIFFLVYCAYRVVNFHNQVGCTAFTVSSFLQDDLLLEVAERLCGAGLVLVT